MKNEPKIEPFSPGPLNPRASSVSVGRSSISISRNNSESSKSRSCGICGFSPKFLQVFTHRYWVLIILSLAFIFQQSISNGFPSTIYRTLEIRFKLNSKQIGLISSCYEIADTAISIFLIHLLQKYSKPLSIGIGLIICSIGAIVFVMPHFLTEPYDPNSAGSSCVTNCSDITEPSPGFTGLQGNSLHYALFLIGMLIIGAGSVPMHSFVPTYLDENIGAKEVPTYHAVFFSLGILGPAFGFLGGGALLKVHTDYDRVDESLMDPDFDESSPVWVGAWWVGIMYGGILLFITAVFVMMLPRYFGENSATAEQDQSEEKVTLSYAAKQLFTNKVWLCMAVANSFDAFVIQVAAGFAVRYLSLTFQINSSTASMVCGVVLILSAILGQMCSSMWLRKQDSEGEAKLTSLSYITLVGPIISTVACFAFILRCPNSEIQGVDFESQSQLFEQSSSFNLLQIAGVDGDVCMDNSTLCQQLPVDFQSRCELGNFDPVCDGTTTFYSSCFAGCNDGLGDCLCANSTNVTSGYCKTDTSPTCEAWKPTVWAVFTTITLFGVFWNMIPYMQLCIRSVPFNLRSQAIAWYSVIARALGSIPGPIFFGAILDTSCVVWEPEEVDSCNPPDKLTAGSCMLFNSRGTSYSWLGMMLITRVLNGLLLMLMHHFAKQRRDQEMKGNGEIELDVNDKIKNSNGTENSKEKTGNVNSSFK
jgi:sodium-independent organic anion transporter